MFHDPVDILNFVLGGLLVPLLVLGCGLVCLMNQRLSKWLLAAMLGFVGLALSDFLSRVLPRMLMRSTMDLDSSFRMLQFFYLAMHLFNAFLFLVIAASLAMAFGDVQKLLRRRDGPGDPRDRMPPPPTGGESWRPRQEGSADIQR